MPFKVKLNLREEMDEKECKATSVVTLLSRSFTYIVWQNGYFHPSPLLVLFIVRSRVLVESQFFLTHKVDTEDNLLRLNYSFKQDDYSLLLLKHLSLSTETIDFHWVH